MADTFLIHLDPANDLHHWSTVNDEGELTSKISSGKLQEFAEQAAQRRVVVLLENSVMYLGSVVLPLMNQQKLLRAIPFAVEDQLADDVEDMHFVFHREQRDSPVAVAAIAHDALQGILERLAAVNIKPAAILPDSLCLSANDEQWCALFDGDQVNFQYGRFTGNEYDSELFDTVLSAQLGSTLQRPARMFLFTPDGEDTPAVPAAGGEDIELVPVSYNTHPLVVYCGNYRQAMPMNLLQHAFKPVSSSSIAWRRWSVAAALALVWLAANLGVSAWQLQQLRTENEALLAQSIELYRTSFPKSKRIVNPRVQMEQKLKELKSGAGGAGASLVSLLASSAQALSANSKLELQSLSYRNGRLDITVSTDNLGSIQILNNQLNSSTGIRSEIISSSSENNAVSGSLRVQQAAS